MKIEFSTINRLQIAVQSYVMLALLTAPACCFQWFKDTNLKVNHNMASKRATTNISFILMPDGIWIRNCLT